MNHELPQLRDTLLSEAETVDLPADPVIHEYAVFFWSGDDAVGPAVSGVAHYKSRNKRGAINLAKLGLPTQLLYAGVTPPRMFPLTLVATRAVWWNPKYWMLRAVT